MKTKANIDTLGELMNECLQLCETQIQENLTYADICLILTLMSSNWMESNEKADSSSLQSELSLELALTINEIVSTNKSLTWEKAYFVTDDVFQKVEEDSLQYRSTKSEKENNPHANNIKEKTNFDEYVMNSNKDDELTKTLKSLYSTVIKFEQNIDGSISEDLKLGFEGIHSRMYDYISPNYSQLEYELYEELVKVLKSYKDIVNLNDLNQSQRIIKHWIELRIRMNN